MKVKKKEWKCCAGFTGKNCETALCSSNCGRGRCVGPEKCDCSSTGYAGDKCDIRMFKHCCSVESQSRYHWCNKITSPKNELLINYLVWLFLETRQPAKIRTVAVFIQQSLNFLKSDSKLIVQNLFWSVVNSIALIAMYRISSQVLLLRTMELRNIN